MEQDVAQVEIFRAKLERLQLLFIPAEQEDDFKQYCRTARNARLGISDARYEEHRKTTNILLLGCGEQGKSTIFKQFTRIFDKDHFDETIAAHQHQYSSTVYYNIFYTCSSIYQYMQNNSISFSQNANSTYAAEIQHLVDTNNSLIITAERFYDKATHKKLISIVNDDTFRSILQNRAATALLHIPAGIEYFMRRYNFHRFNPSTYKPTWEDYLHLYRKTTGIIEKGGTYADVEFTIADTGGQRSERKKWNALFSFSDAVIFVWSLADYNLICYEDDTSNRLHEALDTFEEYVTCFPNKPVILLANKRDLLYRFVEQEEGFLDSLRKTFPDREINEDDVSDAFKAEEFILGLFRERFSNCKMDPSLLFCMSCCAVETESMQQVCKDILDIVRKQCTKQQIK